jgi:hypothetical protein
MNKALVLLMSLVAMGTIVCGDIYAINTIKIGNDLDTLTGYLMLILINGYGLLFLISTDSIYNDMSYTTPEVEEVTVLPLYV